MQQADIKAELQAAGLQRIRADEPLSRHTSWRVGGPADYLAVASTPEALVGAIQVAKKHEIPWLVLGGGSNVLISDQGVDGLVILNRIKAMQLRHADGHAQVEVGSGAFFASLALFTARRGYAGLEWGIAIPGTVGAGVVNNAGAHHGDVERALVRAEGIDVSGSQILIEPHSLGFRYRETRLKQGEGLPVTRTDTVITRASFRVQPDDANRSLALVEELMRRRKETQPISEPSAGSTFKNPNNASAGALIERSGLKGTQVGRAQFSEKHANFIVNLGGAAASDILQLIRLAQTRVEEDCGLSLEPEVQLVGRWQRSDALATPSATSGSFG